MDTYYYEKLLEIQNLANNRSKSRADLTKAIDDLVKEVKEECGFKAL